MKSLISRIRWVRIGCLLCGIMAAGAVGFGYYRDTTTTQLVEYRKTVEAGDTVWSICSKIATDKEDMGKLVWQVMKDNHIENPGALQPGTELMIRVKAAREL